MEIKRTKRTLKKHFGARPPTATGSRLLRRMWIDLNAGGFLQEPMKEQVAQQIKKEHVFPNSS